MRSVVTLVLCLLLFAVGCEDDSKSADTNTLDSPPLVKLQLNWKPEPQFGGFYAAQEFAAKHKIALNVVPGGVGTPTVQMVAAGKVQFAVVSADEVVMARANGADVVALFAVYQTNPQGLMTHRERGFKSIGDIFANPGTVAMQRGLPYTTFLEKKFGFDKVKIVPSPGGDLSAFRNDPNFTMQCFVTSEPIAAKKAGLEVQTFLIAEAGYNPYTTVLVTRGQSVHAGAEVVQRTVAAVRDGWRAYLNDPGKTNTVMQQLNPSMDVDTFVAAAEAQKPLIETDETTKSRLGVMTLERWETLCKQLVDLKVIDKAPPATECFVNN